MAMTLASMTTAPTTIRIIFLGPPLMATVRTMRMSATATVTMFMTAMMTLAVIVIVRRVEAEARTAVLEAS
jgi:hypothetical protein